MRDLARQHEARWRRRGLAVALSAALVGCVALPAVAGAGVERHFEQVSPAEKGDGDIIAEGLAIVASRSGDGATFESRLVFGDAVGSGNVGRTTYLARRGPGGLWSTHSVTPAPRHDAIQVLVAGTKVEVFSDDLSTALVWGYDLPGASDDAPDLNNFYVEDTATRTVRTVSASQADRLELPDFINRTLWGASADAKHLGVVSARRMLPMSEITPGVPNVYKWDDGALSLVGVLPDGSVPSAGSTVEPVDVRGTMSADGSRLAFFSTGDGTRPPQLYLHIDGRESVWVSQPERDDDSDPVVDPTGVHFEGMTPDGKFVFFDSDTPLLDADTNSGPDLYRFEVTGDPDDDANLTLISNDGGAVYDPGGFGTALVGMSDDASRVYYHSIGGRLDLWQEGPGIKTIAGLDRPNAGSDHLGLLASAPGNGRVSPDGEWVAYRTNGEMYLYSLEEDSVTCVSCPSGASLVPTITNTGRLDYVGFRPRFLTDDGRVFFTSTGGLVARDRNGVADVYEYDGQSKELTLLTSGEGKDPAMFADASASGDDVFVVTRGQLVASDRDDYVDLYDVRVGPAPPSQPIDTAPGCEGDGCQGSPSGAPADGALGSLSLEGDEARDSRRAGLVVRGRAAFRGAVGLLSVRVGSAGRLRWSGRGLVAGSARRASAGRVRVRVPLGRRARVKLRRSGRYVTTVRLRLLAADGARASRAVRVTFRAPRKGR